MATCIFLFYFFHLSDGRLTPKFTLPSVLTDLCFCLPHCPSPPSPLLPRVRHLSSPFIWQPMMMQLLHMQDAVPLSWHGAPFLASYTCQEWARTVYGIGHAPQAVYTHKINARRKDFLWQRRYANFFLPKKFYLLPIFFTLVPL